MIREKKKVKRNSPIAPQNNSSSAIFQSMTQINKTFKYVYWGCRYNITKAEKDMSEQIFPFYKYRKMNVMIMSDLLTIS